MDAIGQATEQTSNAPGQGDEATDAAGDDRRNGETPGGGPSASDRGDRTAEPAGADGETRKQASSVRSALVPFLSGQRRRLGVLSLTAILGGFAEAGVLVVIARAAVALASKGNNNHVEIAGTSVSVGTLIAVAAVLVAIRTGFAVWQARLNALTTSHALSAVRKMIVSRFLSASWALQASEREGRLQELLTTYANNVTMAILGVVLGTVAVFSLVALIVTALVVNPVASLAVVAAVALIGLTLWPIRSAVQRRSARAGNANLAFATAVTELASTTQEVRVFDVEEQVRARLDALTDEASTRMRATRFLTAVVPAVYQGVALFLLVAALAVLEAVGVSGLASLGAVVLIMLRALNYGQNAQVAFQGLHEAVPYLETLAAEEQRYSQAAVPRGGAPVGHIGELAFDDVWFHYSQGEPVLRGVSFAAHPGEIIGIVGPSGAGKSTLVQLLLRLRDPTVGHIEADGRDIRGLSLQEWNRHIAFVPQEARLYAGGVADNIRFFREDVDDATIERAARRAHFHDEIARMPLSYGTSVGERGSSLSGGQRQRLCIARALVNEPEIVILDEPTSALDPRSEALMRDTIEELKSRTTVFVIAHRMSTLTICDRIMVMMHGEIQAFDEPGRLEHGNVFYREALKLSGMR